MAKRFWRRMIPVIILVIATIVLSLLLYRKMIDIETENCWERLEIATKNTSQKIQVRLNDNLSFLKAASDSFILTFDLAEEERVGDYLNSIWEMTIFERITVLLPDGRMLMQSGEEFVINGDLAYEELVQKGTHISPRCIDWLTGKEVLYFFTPIEHDGEVRGILSGTLDCETLSKIFAVFTYGNDAQLFLVDCADGNYILDNWHESLENVYEVGTRQSLDGTEIIDFVPIVEGRQTKRVAFISRTNGQGTYQYCIPVDGYNWELFVAVQEDVVFEHVHEMEKIFVGVGIIEAILVFFYFLWNFIISRAAVNSEEKARILELDKAKNEAKAKFISNMSHDVRTPINGIVGMLHIIKNHRDDEPLVDDCLKKIHVSTQYLATLANDMLDINEIESNKLIIENTSIDLRKMAGELSVLVEPKAEDAKVAYHMDCSSIKHPYVMGSEVHIERILVNLISNAIKYSKESGGDVWVSITELEVVSNRGLYQFEVRDNGIGMSEEFQKNMYEAFEQEKGGARSQYQGYGLGLTIVNHLVKKLGGTIELKSRKGEGSTFTVLLPLLLDVREDKPEPEDNTIVDLAGVRILLVEDNKFNMEIAEVVLSDKGAEISSAYNGKIATEIFADSEVGYFDVILMDVRMPEMDGCEASGVIRGMNRPDAKTVPIIALTANAFSEEIVRCKEAGMNEHMAKPLDIDKLMQLIAKYYKKR